MACSFTEMYSVQFSHSVVSDSLGPHESQHARPPLSITNSRSTLRLASIESVMPSSHLILCCPLLLLPPTPPSIRVFKITPFAATWHITVSHLSWNKIHSSYNGNGVILPDLSLKYSLLFFYVLLSDTAKLGYFLFLKKKKKKKNR